MTFLGILIGIELKGVSSLRDCWSQNWVLGISSLACVMPVAKVRDILRYVHLNDNDKMLPRDKMLQVIPCSFVIQEYNSYMGVVDKNDQLKSYYEIVVNSKKWWPRILYMILWTDASSMHIFWNMNHLITQSVHSSLFVLTWLDS